MSFEIYHWDVHVGMNSGGCVRTELLKVSAVSIEITLNGSDYIEKIFALLSDPDTFTAQRFLNKT